MVPIGPITGTGVIKNAIDSTSSRRCIGTLNHGVHLIVILWSLTENRVILHKNLNKHNKNKLEMVQLNWNVNTCSISTTWAHEQADTKKNCEN